MKLKQRRISTSARPRWQGKYDHLQEASHKLQEVISKHVQANWGVTNDFLAFLTNQVCEILSQCREGNKQTIRFIGLYTVDKLRSDSLIDKAAKQNYASLIVNIG